MLIKVTRSIDGRKALVNPARIQMILPEEAGCTLYLTDTSFHVSETIDQILAQQDGSAGDAASARAEKDEDDSAIYEKLKKKKR